MWNNSFYFDLMANTRNIYTNFTVDTDKRLMRILSNSADIFFPS